MNFAFIFLVHRTNVLYNGTSCRSEFIDPLLKCFGWDVSNESGTAPQYRDVITENYVSTTARPDYTLTQHGVYKFFIEAKKPSIDILTSKDAAFQAKRYGWNANHKIVVLTNFKDLIIYDSTFPPNPDDPCTTAMYRHFHFTEYIDCFDEISALISNTAVVSGQFDSFLREQFSSDSVQREKVDTAFLKLINTWRINLGAYLYANAPEDRTRTIDELDYDIQHFINKIVFIRICEDRGLPLPEKLSDVTVDEAAATVRLGRLFDETKLRYNSSIFEGEDILPYLESEIIISIINSLYYPQSIYLFHIIEPNLLGQIYELFLTEKLSSDEQHVVSVSKKRDYENRTIVTTPIEIVRYMVNSTLTKVCKGRTPKEITDLKILDIACGSGIFLEEAFSYLIDYCINWYHQYDPQHLIETGAGPYQLPLDEKKRILQSCIYGVDIDYNATEITVFSLLIKLVEKENEPSVRYEYPILPDLQKNIMCGNSLISPNDLNTKELSNEELCSCVPFDWSLLNNGQPFDVILGNPPYASTEELHKLVNKKEFDIYKQKYDSSYKQFDKYFLFLEKALRLIKLNGNICYIIPNKFFKVTSGKKLRNLLASKQVISSIVDFGDAQLFKEQTVYSAIVYLENRRQDEFTYSRMNSFTELLKSDHEYIQLGMDALSYNPWRLTTNFSLLKLIQKLDSNSTSLLEHVTIFNGIQTSAERPVPVYWFSQDDIIGENEKYVTIKRSGKTYKIEKNILKPYFKPTKSDEKGLNSYSLLHTNKLIIVPYDEFGKLLSIEIMKQEYPYTYKYLCDHYSRLEPKILSANHSGRDVPDATSETWYKYGRTQALTAFINTPKLIVGILSKEPMYVLDKNNMLISSGGTAGYCAIKMKPSSPYALEFIQAWLSSEYTEQVPSVWIPDAFFLRRNNLYPKFVLNCCNAVSTDTMHRMKFNEGLDPEEILLSYYNSISFAFTEICGRSYGGGVLEILPREMGNIRLPKVTGFPENIKKQLLALVDHTVRKKDNIENVLDAVDKAVLIDFLKIEPNICEHCRQIWKKLQSRRLSRG